MDALVYGHVKALTTTRLLPSTESIANMINQFPLIIEHSQLIQCRFFNSELKSYTEDFEVIDTVSEDSWQFNESIESLEPLPEDDSPRTIYEFSFSDTEKNLALNNSHL